MMLTREQLAEQLVDNMDLDTVMTLAYEMVLQSYYEDKTIYLTDLESYTEGDLVE